MVKLNKNQTTLIIVFIGIFLVLGVRYLLSLNKKEIPSQVLRTKGSESAPIKITEFIDFQCPACAQGSKLLKEYLAKNPDKIRLELKYFPLKMHVHSFISAKFAECAARQDKFWPFLDLMIDQQDQWSKLLNARVAFENIAKSVDINLNKLNKCLEDKDVEKIITDDLTAGQQLNIRSTPTYYVNGKLVVGYKTLKEELDRMLNVPAK